MSALARGGALAVVGVIAVASVVVGPPSGQTAASRSDPTGRRVGSTSDEVTRASARHHDKVMVIAEENEGASSVIGSRRAPYVNHLARKYGRLDNMHAGYPVSCPSLSAYLIITSGSQHGICDDGGPAQHTVTAANIFQQVAAAGRTWREYAESMTGACQRVNGHDQHYLVRHAPPPYYTSERSRCQRWDVPLGTTTSGALHQGLVTGLPAYSFVTPNACDDMHGAPSCRSGLVKHGDSWLKRWIPRIVASPDFQRGRLVVIVTWDEGSSTSNHIPTLVISKSVSRLHTSQHFNHCSTLRTTELLLRLTTLGCARTAVSFREKLRL